MRKKTEKQITALADHEAKARLWLHTTESHQDLERRLSEVPGRREVREIVLKEIDRCSEIQAGARASLVRQMLGQAEALETVYRNGGDRRADPNRADRNPKETA